MKRSFFTDSEPAGKRKPVRRERFVMPATVARGKAQSYRCRAYANGA